MKYADAVRDYGLDKPDLRYDMKLTDLTELIHGQAGTAGMPLFKDAGLITAIAVPELGKVRSVAASPTVHRSPSTVHSPLTTHHPPYN